VNGFGRMFRELPLLVKILLPISLARCFVVEASGRSVK